MNPDPTTLRTLVTVIRTGSFSAAGRELGYTASAVSQQMSGLERSIGVQLFERQSRRVIPTEAAQYLEERSRRLLDLATQIEADVERLAAGQAGRIRIGSFESAGRPIMAQALARFLVRRRDVGISLDEGEPHELFPRVVTGDLDVALGFRYDNVPTSWPPDIALVELLVDQIHLIAHRRHRLAGKDQIDLADLRYERWIANREDTAASRCLMTLAENAGFEPNIAFRSNSFGTVRGYVAEGLGVSLMPGIALRPGDGTVSLPLRHRLPRRQVVAAVRRVDDNPLTDAFLAAIRHVTKCLPGAEA